MFEPDVPLFSEVTYPSQTPIAEQAEELTEGSYKDLQTEVMEVPEERINNEE